MESVLPDIQRVIDWYSKEYAGASIEHLMDAKSRILTLCARFAEEVAANKKDSVMSTVFRKADFHDLKSRLIDEGFTVGLAESKGTIGVKAQMKHEADTEALFFKSKLVLDIALKIAEDMTQRISILKKEKDG